MRSSISAPQFAQVRMSRFGSGWRGGAGRRSGGVGCIGEQNRQVGARLASVQCKEVHPMETDRTKDSVEQIEEAQDLPNPITDDDATLGEAGDAAIPDGEAPETDKDAAEGPAPRTTQMPR